jgi:hypothetical protein
VDDDKYLWALQIFLGVLEVLQRETTFAIEHDKRGIQDQSVDHIRRHAPTHLFASENIASWIHVEYLTYLAQLPGVYYLSI